ncbi:MAG: biotin/lipoyl-containing protein [Pseudomonadota bacterium]
MTVSELQQVAAWLADTDIGLFELRTAQGLIRLRRNPGSAGFVDETVSPDVVNDAAGVVAAPTALLLVAAPSVGVFLHHHPLRTTPLAPIGTTVQADQVVGLLQIGDLLLAVTAPQAGVVASVLMAHGSLVGYGVPLFELQPLLSASAKP